MRTAWAERSSLVACVWFQARAVAGIGRAIGAKREFVEPWGKEGVSGVPRSGAGWAPEPGSGVPTQLFVRAMTSLAPHYRDDHEALEEHLREEHAIFSTLETPGGGGGGGEIRRAHLCCADYGDGPALKAALETAAGGGDFVRTALNSYAAGGYCAVAHVSSAFAARAAAEDGLAWIDARCSPLTHASKEPLSLLRPARNDPAPVFGMRLGPAVQGGQSRGLVITMSPGSLPLGGAARKAGGGGGGSADPDAETRKLSASASRGEGFSSSPPPSAALALETAWRVFWNDARGKAGAGALAETVPWTSRSADLAGGSGRRGLLNGDDGIGSRSRAREFHGGKAAGYRAAIEHVGRKMEEATGGGGEVGEGGGASLGEACGWESNLAFVHGGDDLLYMRGIHHPDHDEATSAACFISLVGFLSAQPEVMHIHPEAKAEANNKVLTAYIEGGEPTETPMRLAGLTGTGEVIGVTDTGLDESSCFFKDPSGLVPRTTMVEAQSYPEQRKVIQYVVFADDKDSDGHGTHVAGIAAGKIYDDWEAPWEEHFSGNSCEDAGLIRSCFGDCIEGTVGGECHWNPELSCPLSYCDEDISCDDFTGYDFPCFGNPVDELPEASGVAPDAKLAFFDIGSEEGGLEIPDDIGDMWDAQYAAGARVMSNSWSLVTMTEPTARDVQLDEWVHAHPDTLVVFGAGNNGYEDGGFNPGSVQSPATGKTSMTVGATNSGPDRAYAYYSDTSTNYDGVLWPSEEANFQVSPFSARGPVGRFTAKPDVVAPGLMVHSAKASLSDTAEETCALDSLGGTSMSAPAVAGAAALVRQFFATGVLADYLREFGLCTDGGGSAGATLGGGVYEEVGLCEAFFPSGYLVKAVLVNSAMWLGDMQTVSYGDKLQDMSVLDFAQGFGTVQLASSVPTNGTMPGAFFHDHELSSNGTYYYSVYVSDTEEAFSVTLAWFDPPSPVSSYNLIHDLDVFVMSVDTRQIFRSNHYATLLAMCGGDELCAQKYEFTFDNNLADDFNPVERVTIQTPDLQTGYYVIGVRARTLTESDTQAYGLAAAGGGLELSDLAEDWADLGIETQSSGDGEPDPDAVIAGTPAPAGDEESSSASAAPTPAPGVSSSDRTIILHPTPAPKQEEPSGSSSSSSAGDGDEATSGSAGGTTATPSSASSSAGDESRESAVTSTSDVGAGTSSVSPSPSPSSAAGSGAGVSYFGGGDDDAEAASLEPEGPGEASSDISGEGGGGGGGGGIPLESTVAASVAGAVLLIGAGVCLVVRRNKARSSASREDETGSFLCPNRHNSSSAVATTASLGGEATAGFSDGHLEVGGGLRGAPGDGMEEVSMVFEEGMPAPTPGSATELPGYAMAVASVPEEVGHTTIMDSSGVERVVELAAGDEFEVAGFYAAVDPGAVETLVSWGISRDFARVALRRSDNDVPAALKIIAEGNMDELLAEDHEEMAREGEEEAAAAAAAAAAAGVDYHGAV